MTTPQPTHWFPQTKLHAPYLGSDILVRANLVHQLQQAIIGHRLTLISAPAGSGKTTLVATWQNQTDTSAPVAWLRLDQADNDPVAFLTGLVASLRQLEPSFGPNLDTLIATLAAPEQQIRRIIGVFINNIVTSFPTPIVLILDDLHTLTDPTIHHALNYLLEHLPPSLAIVATTRYQPALSLSRLRARGQLAELHLEALRFTASDAHRLLNDQLRLDLSDSELALLQTRTEGWAAGLRLLALSLGRLSDPDERSAFIRHLAQTDRYIFDFLADEVFGEQPDDVQTFLLETSILTELTPALCAAVTQRSTAAQLLDDVYRRNLFLTTSISETMAATATFRYHDLFADFLRHRLQHTYPPATIQMLHRRAAAVATPAKAIQHYLTGQLWDEACQRIIEVGRQQLQQGFVQLPAHWLAALPDAIRAENVWLQLFSATAQVQTGRMAEAQLALEKLRPIFAATDDLSGEIYSLMGLGQVYMAQGRIDQGALAAEQLLQKARTPVEQVGANLIKLWAAHYQHQWAQVDTAIDQMLNIVLSSGDRGATQMSVQGISPELLFGKVKMSRFEQYCHHNLTRFGTGGDIIEAGTQMMLGGIYFLRGDLSAARQATARVQTISQQFGGLGWTDVVNGLVVLMTALADGAYAKIEQYVSATLAMGDNMAQQRYLGPYYYAWARALWLDGRLGAVQRVYEQMSGGQGKPAGFPIIEITLPQLIIRSLIERSQGHMTAAEKTLRTALPLSRQLRHSILTGQPQLELVSLYLDWGRPDEALAELRPVLADLARRGLPGVILAEGRSLMPVLEMAVKEGVEPDFAHQILATWTDQQKPRPITVPTTGETLTPREAEVLHLIADGASNRAIAETLVITERTVKSHVTKILAKLDVSSRTEAVARANQLKLL